MPGMHIHPTLNIVKSSGAQVIVPADIGINPALYQKREKFAKYMGGSAMAPIHTHDMSGLLHVEAVKPHKFTLGNLIDIWGVDLKPYKVKLSIDGAPVRGYRGAQLRDGQILDMTLTPKRR